jgi:hypothetical protein
VNCGGSVFRSRLVGGLDGIIFQFHSIAISFFYDCNQFGDAVLAQDLGTAAFKLRRQLFSFLLAVFEWARWDDERRWQIFVIVTT